MNNILTIKRLAEQISKATGQEQSVAEEFVKALADQISESLGSGEEVKIKGFGKFYVDSNQKAVFAPSQEMADAINEPFSMFAAEELSPGATAEGLYQASRYEEIESPSEPAAKAESAFTEVAEAKATPEEMTAEAKSAEEESSEEPLAEEPKPEDPSMIALESAAAPFIPGSYPEEEEEEDAPAQAAQPKFPTFWVAWGVLFGFIAGLCVGFFVHDPIEKFLAPSLEEDFIDDEEYIDDAVELPAIAAPTDEEEEPGSMQAPATQAEAEAAAEPESAQASPAPVEKEPAEVYDTIREGNSLGSMARKHYGANVYWVYIYLENKSKIKNPNRVSVGTKLLIPPLSKYTDKKSESERRSEAQKKVDEILRMYPN